MIRAWVVLMLSMCGSTAWAQYPIYPARPQIPASAYGSAFSGPLYPPQFATGVSPYGYGHAPYGLGMGGYFSPYSFGNVGWLPPNPPSPYYVTPTGREYLEQARRKDQAKYSELMLQHYLKR